MPPDGTGWTAAIQAFGPTQGAVTWLSWREEIGAAKDWKAGV